ncbi:MAG: response regulator transcription factor [Bacteroidetes bacterium]|nr:response regulator transcription factor [Bacteroidota bacterium]
MQKRILLIEDEKGLVLTLVDRLNSEGYIVASASDGESGERLAVEKQFDLILLDVMLPGKNGFDIVRDLRSHGISTPVLMLTARGQLNEKVVGLKLGADDYLTKPFEMLELLARIESLLRRPNSIASAESNITLYKFGPFTVDFEKMEIKRKGQAIEFSSKEFQILRYFIEHPGVVLSRETILNDVWGYNSMPATRTVDTHIAWIRQKIEDNPKLPKFIITVHGFGYKFNA